MPASTTPLLLLAVAALTACRSIPSMTLPTPQVDIPRYMGDWYVIGGIPTPLEKDAFNAIENYSLETDGTIKTTFTYRKGSFDGKPKKIGARGFVKDDPSHAVWGMQFIWPIKADYRIAWISPDYSQVVVAREKRDYLWIMARSPVIPDGDYAKLTELAVSLGYDPAEIKKSPQDGAQVRRH
jgi:apolipoprotein D and lipocalin family protein